MNFFSLALLSTGAFISTNIDDLFLLVGFFSDRSFSRLSIFTGQILGIASLVAISLAAAFAALAISPAHVGLLGVAPVVIGIGQLLRLGKIEDEGQPTALGILEVAAITIVNGGDNIAAYTPIFANQTSQEIGATVAISARSRFFGASRRGRWSGIRRWASRCDATETFPAVHSDRTRRPYSLQIRRPTSRHELRSKVRSKACDSPRPAGIRR